MISVIARECRGVAVVIRTKMFQSRQLPTGRKHALHSRSAVQRLKPHGVRMFAACEQFRHSFVGLGGESARHLLTPCSMNVFIG